MIPIRAERADSAQIARIECGSLGLKHEQRPFSRFCTLPLTTRARDVRSLRAQRLCSATAPSQTRFYLKPRSPRAPVSYSADFAHGLAIAVLPTLASPDSLCQIFFAMHCSFFSQRPPSCRVRARRRSSVGVNCQLRCLRGPFLHRRAFARPATPRLGDTSENCAEDNCSATSSTRARSRDRGAVGRAIFERPDPVFLERHVL